MPTRDRRRRQSNLEAVRRHRRSQLEENQQANRDAVVDGQRENLGDIRFATMFEQFQASLQ